jgi:hypothetical protein
MSIRDSKTILLQQLKNKIDNLPIDPADQSEIANLISGIEDMFVVPTADSTDNNTIADVLGNKIDTVAGNSVIALLKAIKAKTDLISGS